MILDCIRHGVTASNLEFRFNYSHDEALAPAALVALAELRAIEAAHYDLVYVSPMRRAEETARRLGVDRHWVAENVDRELYARLEREQQRPGTNPLARAG